MRKSSHSCVTSDSYAKRPIKAIFLSALGNLVVSPLYACYCFFSKESRKGQDLPLNISHFA